MAPDSSTGFEKMTELGAEWPTLIEGLPKLGLVAAISVDQITKQLGWTSTEPSFPTISLQSRRSTTAEFVTQYASTQGKIRL